MTQLRNRLERLEQRLAPAHVRVEPVELDVAVDSQGALAQADLTRIDAARADAVARGWRPADGPYCIVVGLTR
jgi:hypothetical protein